MEMRYYLMMILGVINESKTYPYIDKLYMAETRLFYQNAVKSELYDNENLRGTGILKIIYARRFLGILVEVLKPNSIFLKSEDYYKMYTDIFEKGFYSLLNKITAKGEIKMQALIRSYADTDNFIEMYFLIQYLGVITGTKIIDLEDTMRDAIYDGADQLYYNGTVLKITGKSRIITDKDVYAVTKSVAKNFLKKYPEFENSESFGSAKYSVYEEMRTIGLILQSEGISNDIFNEINFGLNDMIDIIYSVCFEKYKEGIESAEYDKTALIKAINLDNIDRQEFLNLFYIKYLSKLSRKLEDEFFKFSNEAMLLNFEEKKKTVNKLASLLREEQEKNALLTKENEEIKKQVRNKDLDIEEYKKLKREVISLREMAFKEELDDEYITEENHLEALKDIAKNHKIIFMGGSDITRKYFKETYGFKTVSGEQMNFDTEIFNDCSLIVFSIRGASHSFYYKMVNGAKNTPYIIIRDSNVKKIEKSISDYFA